MSLTSRQVSYLKGLAHEKKPVILLGKNGITDAVIKETANALHTHELIKVRLIGEDAAALDGEADTMATRAEAQLVERIGKIAILYKRRKDEPTIVLPKEPKAPKPA